MMNSNQNRSAAQGGFTLIEILVAVMILAIALGSAIKSIGQSTQNVAYLRDKTFAHWVAMNRAAELQSLKQWPSLGGDRGTEEMANHEWYWRFNVVESGIDSVRRVEIEVRRNSNDKQPLATLVALVGKNAS
jgi:general secretion pathway protein I